MAKISSQRILMMDWCKISSHVEKGRKTVCPGLLPNIPGLFFEKPVRPLKVA
jgi:hypothetical protein